LGTDVLWAVDLWKPVKRRGRHVTPSLEWKRGRAADAGLGLEWPLGCHVGCGARIAELNELMDF